MIALFYVGDFFLLYFALAIGIFLALLAINRLGVRHLAFYLIPGALMWYGCNSATVRTNVRLI